MDRHSVRPIALAFALIWCAGARAAVPITYEVKEGGNVSLAVYDSKGVQVRTLTSAVPRQAGSHTALWDGLDRRGCPVPAGEYAWRLLLAQGLESKYLMSVGTSTKDVHWPGSHNGPAAVAVDAKNGYVYMAAGIVEGGSQVVKLDMDGRILWVHLSYEGWGQIRDMVFSGTDPGLPGRRYPDGVIYLPHVNSGHLHILDPGTGDACLGRKEVAGEVAEGKVEPLQAPFIRIDLGGHARPVAEGWVRCGLETYTAHRGFGWREADDLLLSSSGAGAVDGGGVRFPALGPARKQFLRQFLIKVPDDMHFCEVRLMVGAAENLAVYSGLAYGKPNLRRTRVQQDAKCEIIEFEAKAKNGMLDITLGNKEGTQAGWDLRGIEVLVPAERFDAHNGKRIAIFPSAGRIQQINPKDWRSLSETMVPDVRDATILDDGRVLALSGNRVVLVDEKGGAHRPMLEGLSDPRCLSVDRKTEDLFIADWGDSHQIKRFSKDYQPLGTFGRKGGRLEGQYEPQDFKFVAGVEGDGRGGFFVVEHWLAPRRLAHFDAQGKLVREWYGGQRFFTNASLDLAQKNRVWIDSHFGWVMEVKVDWQNGEWRPYATYQYDGLANGLLRTLPGGNHWMLRYHDGQRYLVCTNGPTLLKVEEDKRRLRPVALCGVPPTKEENASRKLDCTWTDLNDDGTRQEDENVVSPKMPNGIYWFVDEDLTYYGVYATGRKADNYTVFALAPRWQKGIPIYPKFEDARRLALEVDDSFAAKEGVAAGVLPLVRGFFRDEQGAFYMALHGAGDGFTAQGEGTMGHGFRWPSDLIGDAAVAKWDPSGTLLWKVSGLASERVNFVRDRLNFPTKIIGKQYGCIGVGDRIALPMEMWTEDGLYVGGLFDRRAKDGLPDNCYTWWRVDHSIIEDEDAKAIENKGVLQYDMNAGREMMRWGDNELLFLGAGWNNLPTYRVSGFDRFVRQEGTIRLVKPAQAAAGRGAGLCAEFFASKDLSGPPALVIPAPQVWYGTGGKKQMEKPWPDSAVTRGEFSARWTGFLEPCFTEPYRLSVYVGESAGRTDSVRLWVNGKMVIDAWDKPAGRKLRSTIVPLEAGLKVPIRLEYLKKVGQLHLCWESASQPIEHVPVGYLYPPKQETVATQPAVFRDPTLQPEREQFR